MVTDDDLKVFLDACQKFDQEISIRGSTAYVLSRNAGSDGSDSTVRRSIVQSVPPLGDLDLVVRDDRPAAAMRKVGEVLEHYRTYVPASRFIHVDVFYEHLPVRGDSPLGNVVIEGLPELTIKRLDDGKTFKPRARDERVRASVALRVPATLFRDFLYLLRLSQRHKELDDATEKVAALLRRQRPSKLGLATQAAGGMRELARIDRALVKHVLLRDPKQEPRRITQHLPKCWLRRFERYLNRLSRRITSSEEHWLSTDGIAYAVSGKVIQLVEVAHLEEEEKKVLDEKLGRETTSPIQTLPPSLKVLLPTPDGPECCEYRDFSKGISELVWRDPDGGHLLDVVLMEGCEKYYAVHAQAAAGFGARSLRTDPGFMGMLDHGSLGTVRLMGVRKR